MRQWLVVLSLLSLVGCDHATKHWAESNLQHGAVDVVPGVLGLSYARNTDVAFHMLRWVPDTHKQQLIVSLGSLAVIALVVLLVLRRRAQLVEQACYALLLAGAIGNLVDRFVRGYVVDFIHVSYWPVFNVADTLIVGGMLLLLWTRRRARAAPAEPA